MMRSNLEIAQTISELRNLEIVQGHCAIPGPGMHAHAVHVLQRVWRSSKQVLIVRAASEMDKRTV